MSIKSQGENLWSQYTMAIEAVSRRLQRFTRATSEVMGVGMFLNRADPNPRYAVHLVWAGE